MRGWAVVLRWRVRKRKAAHPRRVTHDIHEAAAVMDITGYAEYHWLAVRFSSGVTLKELVSIAEIAATLAKVQSPSRNDKRNFKLMVCWFKSHWDQLTPWLHLIQLHDEEMNVIDGNREVKETGKRNFSLTA
jgi:hypothetical protein